MNTLKKFISTNSLNKQSTFQSFLKSSNFLFVSNNKYSYITSHTTSRNNLHLISNNSESINFNKSSNKSFSEKSDEITLKRLVNKYTPTKEEQESKSYVNLLIY